MDAQRSLQRYVAAALGDGWDVRLWADDGALATVPQVVGGQVVHRMLPTLLVRLNGPTSVSGSAWDQTVTQTMRLFAYPPPADTESESSVAATRVQDTLCGLLVNGLAPDGTMVGWPLRVPLWDFDGLALDDDTEPPRGDRDYVRVVPPVSFDRTHDPQDERRVIVTGDVRLSWGRALVPVVERPTVQSVTIRQGAGLGA